MAKKHKAGESHSIPPPLKPEAASEFVLRDHPPHDERDVRDYVEAQTRGKERVRHAERLTSERVFGRELQVWDVHTNKDRYWVITNPTNLYSQKLFPSADYTLSFHIGLVARMTARDRGPVSDEQEQRSAAAWRRWRQAGEAFDRADEAEDFQAVGMRCRECLLEMIRSFADQSMVPKKTEAPKKADFPAWCDLIVAHVAPGAGADELRHHMRAVAKSVWRYVNWLTHAQNAGRFDAMVALESTQEVLGLFGAATIRQERGIPERCPSCESYLLDSVYEPELESEHPYVTICRRCGWLKES